MAIELSLVPEVGIYTPSPRIGDVQTYSVSVDAIPTDATDSSGGTWSMDVTASASLTKINLNGDRVNLPGADRSTAFLGKKVILSDYGMFSDESKYDYQKQDYGRGGFRGTVSSMSITDNSNLQLTIDGILFKLNCEKTAQPHFGATATQKTAFIYYCSLAGLTIVADNIDNDFDIPVAYPAWKGNVWEYIKMFCVANQADIFVDANGSVHLEKIRKNTIPVVESSGVSMGVTLLGTSRTVEVYDYDTSWEQDALIYLPQTTFQVNTGEKIKETVDIQNSTITSKIFQPVCVSTIPQNFKGGQGKSVYVVIDNLNIPVSPDWWNGNGGKVSVAVAEDNPMQLEISIEAPNQTNSAYVEPFRLAEYDTDVRPALYICGEGVVVNKILRSVSTGADQTFISRDSKATVDNPFIHEASYHLAQSAAFASGPSVDVSLTIGTSKLADEINNITGARFFYNNGYYRVSSANISESGISITGKVDTVFDDLVSTYSVSFNNFNTTTLLTNFASLTSGAVGLYGGNTISAFNSYYPAKTFTELGPYYNNMTFSDMTVMPLGDTLNPYVN
jgi:hypothetical protein